MAQDNAQRVEFTRQQIEYLNKQFPEVAGTQTTTDAELRWRSGQRSVIAFLATRQAAQSPGD